MKKYLFVSAITALSLASCSNEEFLGEVSGNDPSAVKPAEISFGGETGKITRADITGKDAAAKLSNKFIIYGYKTVGSEKKVVYDHYNVVWTNPGNDAGAWEYVGKEKNTLNQTEGNQSIKYWDYAASQYDFIAFSLGSNTTDNVTITRIENATNPTFSLNGSFGNINSCYVADRVTKKPSDFGKKVELKLFALGGSSVEIGIYEEIPGYSIKDIKFYESSTAGEATNVPTLYAASQTIEAIEGKGTLTISFNNDNKATFVKSNDDSSSSLKSSITFGESLTLDATKEDNETTESNDKYIGRTRDKATMSGRTSIVPVYPRNVGALTLKVDYTLIATDGSGETIEVKGATATIPNTYTNWQNNCIYSYIFKISQNTNGSTGGSVAGLNPIVFDAAVIEQEDGIKETVTESEVKEGGQTEVVTPAQAASPAGDANSNDTNTAQG